MIDLKEFRRTNGLTQAVVADYLGVSEPFISRVESGRDPLPVDKLFKLMNNDRGWNITSLIDLSNAPTSSVVATGPQRIKELLAAKPKDPFYSYISETSPDIQRARLIANASPAAKNEGLYDEKQMLKKRIEELEKRISDLEEQNKEYWELIKKLSDK